MKRKFSFRILLFVALLLLSLFCIMVASLPFFTKTHDLGRGFLADAGAFIDKHLGFFVAGGAWGRFSLAPLCLLLLMETFWILNGWKRGTNYVKAFLALPIFLTLRLLFLISEGQALPFPFDQTPFFSDRRLLALLLLGEAAFWALVAGLSARRRKKKKSLKPSEPKPAKEKGKKPAEARKSAKARKPAEDPPAEAPARVPLETSVPEFTMFKKPEADGDGQTPSPSSSASGASARSAAAGAPPIRSSVSLGVYDVVLREAEIERRHKEDEKQKAEGVWSNYQPGNLVRKIAEDEKTKRLWLEMEKRAQDEREAQRLVAQASEEATAQREMEAAEEAGLFSQAEGEDRWLDPKDQTKSPDPEDLRRIKTGQTSADPPPAKEDLNGWNRNVDENYDLRSGIGGLERSPEDWLFPKQTYQFPPKALLKYYPRQLDEGVDKVSMERGRTIINTLSQFKVDSKLVGIIKGPTVTMFEIALAPGIKVSAVTGLADNISMDLAAPQVRLLTPIPGKQAIGVEVPNLKRDIIGFSEIIDSLDTAKMRIPLVLGKKITGENVAMDLAAAPHVLIAGATGSGKSVCVNSIICSILYTKTPAEVRMILVDPKIVELKVYNGIPHLLTPVITEPKKAIKAMRFCLDEMERRYHVIGSVNVRNISAYNEKVEKERLKREKMPYILVIMDEFADLMAVAGKELETMLHRLSAMARAVGIHLVFATQRPSADVVTGLIKNNLPTKIAFSVTNQINSKIILDCNGAEKLLGRGDMLYATSAIRDPERIQGAFLSDGEVEAIAGFVKTQGPLDYLDEGFFEDDESQDDEPDEESSNGNGDDALFDRALKIVCDRQSASASYIQRRLSIGYNKAARLIEKMEELGYVGPARGSKPREVLKYPD